MNTPNFYIIGAPKSGAETIANWLMHHSMVHLPKNTPANFHASDMTNHDDDADHYISCYADSPKLVLGELAPWYLFSDTAVPKILESEPDAKFVVCLRNPVDLAWVLHSAAVSDASEHVECFSTAWAMSHLRRQGRGSKLGADPKTLDYLAICELGTQLIRLASRVTAENIHLIFLEDIQRSPESVWIDLQSFLEIESEPSENYPIEAFLVERPYPHLHVFLRKVATLCNATALRRIRRSGVFEKVGVWNQRTGTLNEMPDHLRRRVCDRLSDDIGIISALTGRDLTHWLC